MIHLLFYALNRFISGAKNGAFYAGKTKQHDIWSLLLIISPYVYAWAVLGNAGWKYQLAIVPSLLFAAMWLRGMKKYLHLWESVTATVYMAYGLLIGADVFLYPLAGMLVNIVCFKGPINYYIGRSWIERIDGTDDSSGKTLGFPTPWGTFYRPRIANGYISLIIGFVFIVIWTIIYKIKLFDIQEVIKILSNLF